MKLNLGCYKDIRENYINVDFKQFGNVDVIHNLNDFPYPFDDNSFEVIICRNLLDHLRADKMGQIFDELYRIAKHDCIIKIKASYGINYMRSIDHTRGFTFNCFRVMETEYDKWVGVDGHWEIIRMDATPSCVGKYIPKKLRNRLGQYFHGLLSNIIVELRVIKNG